MDSDDNSSESSKDSPRTPIAKTKKTKRTKTSNSNNSNKKVKKVKLDNSLLNENKTCDNTEIPDANKPNEEVRENVNNINQNDNVSNQNPRQTTNNNNNNANEKQEQPCWACEYYFGEPRCLPESKHQDILYELYLQQRDTLNIKSLSKILSRYHEKWIYEPQIKAGNLNMLLWPPHIVEKHLSEHMTDSFIELRKRMIAINEQEMLLDKRLMNQNVPNNMLMLAGMMGEEDEHESNNTKKNNAHFISLKKISLQYIKALVDLKASSSSKGRSKISD